MADTQDIISQRRDQIFPRLSEEQIARLLPLGKRRAFQRGDLLFEQGSTDSAFYVVLSGKLEIVRPQLGHEALVVVHTPGEFTGEINLLTGRRTLVRCRAAE